MMCTGVAFRRPAPATPVLQATEAIHDIIIRLYFCLPLQHHPTVVIGVHGGHRALRATAP